MGFFDLGLGLVMSLPSLKDQGSGRTLEEDFMGILEFFLGCFGFEGRNWNWVVVTMKVELRESIC